MRFCFAWRAAKQRQAPPGCSKCSVKSVYKAHAYQGCNWLSEYVTGQDASHNDFERGLATVLEMAERFNLI
jgi:hypothetical protein